MRKTLMTVTLLLAIYCTAFAGEMGTPPIAPLRSDSTQEQGTDSYAVETVQAVLDLIVNFLP